MANYGIKISKHGIDVKAATDDQLVMSSSFFMLKTSSTGTFSGAGTTAHGLSFVPIFLNFAKGGTMARMSLVPNGGVDATNLTFEGVTDKKYYVLFSQAI